MASTVALHLGLGACVLRIALSPIGYFLRQRQALHDQVRELLAKTPRAYGKRGELPQNKDALTKDHRSVASVVGYFRASGASPAALLLNS